ncbi:cyclic peptide export ABC transporter [Paenibacillus sp. NPDC057967]|uniref:cyclic peptide export ABC transporter n=1 Tax=Paenibacillus sp. NPDC057967 TaxID=3346293 RepID=UPI0036DE1087
MMPIRRWLLLVASIVILLSVSQPGIASAADLSGKEAEIEQFIEKSWDKSNIPGMSVVIVNGGQTVYQKGFGHADVSRDVPVTPDTLFELGSTSKAFTALAVLQLEEEGKLNLDENVSAYLPWLELTYKEQPAAVTLRQFLHHTSGVPFETIGDIPVADDEGALEQTVRTLIGLELDRQPGEQYEYATINYDVLGLIIQNVSGQTYEQYVQDRILVPIGLTSTFMFRQEAEQHQFSKGYKVKMLRTAEYDAPMYRGNTPAGYIISNATDMAKWLKIQLGVEEAAQPFAGLLEKSHLPDRSVPPGGDGSSYAAGWSVYQDGSGEISHAGGNPNYSSYFVFRPEDGVGVAVLANLNSPYSGTIAQGIMNLIVGKETPDPVSDPYKGIDNMATFILFVLIPVALLVLWKTGTVVAQAARGSRRFQGKPVSTVLQLLMLAAFIGVMAYCLYRIPDIMFWGLNWDFVLVWAPDTLLYAVIMLLATVVLFGLYMMFSSMFPKPGDRSMFALVLLSIASGFGNAMIIFIVNETLNRGVEDFQGGLFLYFGFGIAVYVVGQKLVRTRLVKIANDMVYETRMELLEKILKTSYQRIENVEDGKIQASLNNDTERISGFSNVVITGATALVTLICCFVYMGIISLQGLLIAMVFIVLAAGLHYVTGIKANKIWGETRDIQNVFFRFINDLMNGFKELSLNARKRAGFQSDMEDSCNTYRDKRIKGDLQYANVNVIGELLFTFVIGSVVFLFPLLFSELKEHTLRNYVFVLLYMTGPIHGILNTIPNAIQIRISWNRIKQLSAELDTIEAEHEKKRSEEPLAPALLELRSVAFHYSNKEGETFSVGPINCDFRPGEITFITGGNGSGKSTLAKLITGLYIPAEGEVRLDGEHADSQSLGEQFSAIFSDFYLFQKMYGIDYSTKGLEIERHLRELQLFDKVQIENGSFNTTKLSTGQRKRLALLISYLDDRPFCLFDEWAADQDPEYRAYFYHQLLPDLKNRGKCVIAITHDDRYFDLADQTIKMEMGQVVEVKSRQLASNAVLS